MFSNESCVTASREYDKSIVVTQKVPHVILHSDQVTNVSLSLTPLHPGELTLVGVGYRYDNYYVAIVIDFGGVVPCRINPHILLCAVGVGLYAGYSRCWFGLPKTHKISKSPLYLYILQINY